MAVWQRRWVASTNRTQSGHLRASWITVAWIGSQFTFSLCRDALHRTSRVALYTLRVRTEAFECFFLFFSFFPSLKVDDRRPWFDVVRQSGSGISFIPKNWLVFCQWWWIGVPIDGCAWNVIFQRGKVVERKVIETKSFVWFHFSSRVDRLPTE